MLTPAYTKNRTDPAPSDNSGGERYDGYKGGANSTEWSWCRWPSRWRLCSRVDDRADWAGGEAYDAYPSPGGDPSKADLGRRNALGHVLWSSRMTWDFGSGTASEFLDRHEAGADPSDPDHEADLYNNFIGQMLAILYKGAGFEYCDLERDLRRMVENGSTANWSRAG